MSQLPNRRATSHRDSGEQTRSVSTCRAQTTLSQTLMATIALLAWAAAASAPASGSARAHNTTDFKVALLQLPHGTSRAAPPLPGSSAPTPVLYPLGCVPFTCRVHRGCASRNDDSDLSWRSAHAPSPASCLPRLMAS